VRWAVWLVILAGCGEPEPEAGLVGRYNVQVDGLIGCDNDPDLVAWMLGPLQVTGTAQDQRFDFGDGYELVGSTSESGAFNVANVLEIDGDRVSVNASGTSEGEPGAWVLTGSASTTLTRTADSDATDDTDGDTQCTITATFNALQIAG